MKKGEFHMTILGRTIEHLGTQMYKHRSPAIAELVANCWDAGSTNAYIFIPQKAEYDIESSEVVVLDDGEGMDEETVESKYLVVGRNRRSEDYGESHSRKVMGRKGIGKLAGFGLAGKVTITTWKATEEAAIQFSMSLQQLKVSAGKVQDTKFPWTEVKKRGEWPSSGTEIRLSVLRHKSPIDIEALQETLARRFSRTTRGEMSIYVNNVPLVEPSIDSMHEFPTDKKYEEAILGNGSTVKYRYSFAKKPISSKELQGFSVYANGRTAQAPPFFFNVETTASSQHSTRYITGEIIADYLDANSDDESDLISTDRQELDWEKEELRELKTWGEELTRRILRQCGEIRGKSVENWILQDKEFSKRLALLDKSTTQEISKFLNILGQKSDEGDDRTRSLADSLIRAYEFRIFHDVIDDIDESSEDPDKLEDVLWRLHDWKVLESRAILEIVQGRISIINKFEKMIVNNSPETASSKSSDNFHDLLAEYPWIFNPEWQVFTEEKSISKQLHDWGISHCPEDMKLKRVDFLAFTKSSDTLVIIEMKRPGHAVTFEETQRLEEYQVALMAARPIAKRVLVYGGSVNIPKTKWDSMCKDEDFEAITWAEMFSRAKSFYSHYESLLSSDVTAEGFIRKKSEVIQTRAIIDSDSSHRGPEDRKSGLGNQDL